jgi:hypothetical protein
MTQISEWIVRGGLCKTGDLQAAYKPVLNMPGVYGFSVQYAPGVSVDDLIVAGRFPHTWVSWADRDDLEKALQKLGYVMLLIRTAGRGFHHDLAVSIMQQGQILDHLPQNAAAALSAVFKQHQKQIKP